MIEFIESNQWYASGTENDSKPMGPFTSKEEAIRNFANMINKITGLAPFYVHTEVMAVLEPSADEFLEWVQLYANKNGVSISEELAKVGAHPKAMAQLNTDIHNALTKAFAVVQISNKVTMRESHKVYPRDYMKYIG
jgi:hypothetical protein